MKNYPIEKQVCTLKQARELAGLLGENAPESCFVWGYSWPVNAKANSTRWRLFFEDEDLTNWDIKEKYYAYTGAELGALLPARIYDLDGVKAKLRTAKDINMKSKIIYRVAYYIPSVNWQEMHKRAFCETHADADLAIQALKEGWIKPEEFKYA